MPQSQVSTQRQPHVDSEGAPEVLPDGAGRVEGDVVNHELHGGA